MAHRHRAHLGRIIRPRPKSVYLSALHANHREALDADWLATYHTTWKPVTLAEWLNAPADRKPKANYGIGQAWRLTRQILRNHTSHCFAALAGWTYTPTGAEIAMWDMFELEGRLQREGWRPWTDRHADPFAPTRLETSQARKERLERRELLKQRFHITD